MKLVVGKINTNQVSVKQTVRQLNVDFLSCYESQYYENE